MTPDLDPRWSDRLERALALLAARLDDPPGLEALASAAAVSPFHFHRLWRAATGEPVGATVARLRIALSQQRLAEKRMSVTDAALAGGFATPQSFTRAFRRVTGRSPSAFLAEGGAPPAPPEHAAVRIELRAPCTLVALRREGGAYVRLNALFQEVWDWAEEAGRLGALLGLYGRPLDDPESLPEARLRYEAALDLGPGPLPPAPFRRLELPGAAYARLRVHGSYDGLEAADQALMAWVLRSGREPLGEPLLHHFHNDPESVAEADLVTDVLLALHPDEDAR